jgi:hypothetical protein
MGDVPSRVADLIRIVGQDRDEHSPRVVRAAESEIARRCGGTRKQAERRIAVAGAVGVLLGSGGIAVVIAAALVGGGGFIEQTLHGASAWERSLLWCLLCIEVLASAFFVFVGWGLLERRAWVLKVAPGWSQHFAILTMDPPFEELLDTVGPGREDNAPERVVSAERELSERMIRFSQTILKRVRATGAVVAFGGGLSAVAFSVSVILVATITQNVWSFAHPPWEIRYLLPFLVALTIPVVGAAAGLGVLAAGLALRKQKAWGRKTILVILWSCYACMVALAATAIVWTLLVRVEELDVTAFTLMVLGIAGLGAFLCVAFTRELSRPEVREACGEVLQPISVQMSAEEERWREKRGCVGEPLPKE